jgi:hypothetical protein
VPNVPLAHKLFWMHPMILHGDEAQVKARFSVHLKILLTMTQDRCTVCVERTIGSEIILDALDGTLR